MSDLISALLTELERNTMAFIYDGFGKPLGSTRESGNGKTNVYDSGGRPLGEANKLGSWGKNSSKISSTSDVGLIIKKK